MPFMSVFFTTECYSTEWLYHFLSIHSSVGRYLGCFQFLAIIINEHLCTNFLCICFQFSWVHLRMELLGYTVTLWLNFWGLPNCFNIGCTTLQSHQWCMRVPFFLHPRQCLLFSVLFYYSQYSVCEVVSHCGFILHSLNN